MIVTTVKKKKRMFLGTINLAIFGVIIVVGLWPFNFWPENRVKWLKDQSGLHFFDQAIIYSTIPFSRSSSFPIDSFSLEIWLQPGKESYDYTARILSLYDGERTENIVISQWKSGLILQRGITKDHPEESFPKVGLKGALPKGVKRFFTITSGPGGTKIYSDGKLTGKYPKFHLFESGSNPGYLILGRSPGGRQSWNGNLYGLAIYNPSLTEEQVSQHFQRWINGEQTSLLRENGVFAFYLFDERSGNLARDHVGNHHLIVPSKFKILRKTVLVPPWKDFRPTCSYVTDMLTNILGFIPFGFFFSVYLSMRRPGPTRRLFLISVVSAGLMSLLIELAQVYLPTRSSQLMDVICNILGAGFGALAFLYSAKRRLALTNEEDLLP